MKQVFPTTDVLTLCELGYIMYVKLHFQQFDSIIEISRNKKLQSHYQTFFAGRVSGHKTMYAPQKVLILKEVLYRPTLAILNISISIPKACALTGLHFKG